MGQWQSDERTIWLNEGSHQAQEEEEEEEEERGALRKFRECVHTCHVPLDLFFCRSNLCMYVYIYIYTQGFSISW